MMPLVRIATHCLLLLAFAPPLSAAVYQSVGEDGSIVFSDVPPMGDARQMEVRSINTTRPFPQSSASVQEKPDEPQQAPIYALQFTSPQPEQTIRSNNGEVVVQLSLQPGLQAEGGDQLVVTLNGEEVIRGSALGTLLKNISRGAHTLSARVESANGAVRARAKNLAFYVQRYSALHKRSGNTLWYDDE